MGQHHIARIHDNEDDDDGGDDGDDDGDDVAAVGQRHVACTHPVK